MKPLPLSLIAALLLPVVSEAATYVIPPSSRGTYQYSSPYPGFDGGYASGGAFDVGTQGTPFNTNQWRLYFTFNLSGIPADESISSVRFLGSGHASIPFNLVFTTTDMTQFQDPDLAVKFASLGGGISAASAGLIDVQATPFDAVGTAAFVDYLNQTSHGPTTLSSRSGGGRGWVDSLSLQVETVPEPASAALLLGGAGVLLGRRRER